MELSLVFSVLEDFFLIFQICQRLSSCTATTINDTCYCRMGLNFFKNKLYMHNLQKKLRIDTVWSVNTNPLNSVVSEILSFGCCVVFSFKLKKNMWACQLFLSKAFFFLYFFLLFLSVKAAYIFTLLCFLVWNLPLKSHYKRRYLLPATVSYCITRKYYWLDLKKFTIRGYLKTKVLQFYSSQRWWK